MTVSYPISTNGSDFFAGRVVSCADGLVAPLFAKGTQANGQR